MANFANPEDFTNISWIKTGSSINANAAVAPDGTTTGDRLNSTVLGLSYVADGANSHTLDAAGSNCINVFAKEDDSGYGINITTFNWDPVNSVTYFDLVNGAVGSLGAGHDSAQILKVGDWYRCTVVLTSTTDLDGNIRIYVVDGNEDTTSPADASVFIWGAYSNAGATPTPYVSEAGITVPSSSARIIRNVTRDVTSNVTKNLIDF